MKEARTIQPTCHQIHMSVEHVAGAMCQRMIISQNKTFDFRTICEQPPKHIRGILFCPVKRVLRLLSEKQRHPQPDRHSKPVGKVDESFFQVFASLTDFDEGMQEAFDDDNQWKQVAPGSLRGLPSVRIDCLRRIAGFEICGSILKADKLPSSSVSTPGQPKHPIHNHLQRS